MKTTSLLAVALLLCACVVTKPPTEPSPDIVCEDSGPENTQVHYGNARLTATPVTKISKKRKWRFNLHPQNAPAWVDYSDAVVTITSKTPTYSWLSVSGKHSDSSELIVCVPDGLEDGTIIEYMINVQWVGTLDPRGVVDN